MEAMYLHYFTNNENPPFFIQFGGHNEDMRMHMHKDFCELVIVLSGTATHAVDNEEYVISRGDVFVINDKISHGYRNTENFRICNIMFKPEIFNEDRTYIGSLSGFHALFVIEPYLTENHSFQSRLKLTVAEYDTIKPLLDTMLTEYKNKDFGWQSVIRSMFIILTATLSRNYSFKDISDKSSVIYIAKSIAYIDEHFREKIYLDELAEMTNLSLRHFTRLFTSAYKITPLCYINSLRLNFACELLKNSSVSISEIAYSSGFSDSNYFSRIFKKNFGKSPVEYRKNVIRQNS